MAANTRTLTKVHKSFIQPELATFYYQLLASTIPWVSGVKSKNGFTRLAYPIQEIYDTGLLPDTADILYQIITAVLQQLNIPVTAYQYAYINWYQQGNHYTPNHSHSGQRQVVISLGATRTFHLGGKDFPIENGDVIIFGSASHGIPREPQVKDGRISIALFLDKSN